MLHMQDMWMNQARDSQTTHKIQCTLLLVGVLFTVNKCALAFVLESRQSLIGYDVIITMQKLSFSVENAITIVLNIMEVSGTQLPDFGSY